MEAHTEEKFANEKLEILVRRKPRCEIEMEVKAFPLLQQAARAEAIKTVNKSLTIPGFRKGRAPEDIVLKKYASHVEKELQNTLANTAFQEAQKLSNVRLLHQNSRVTFHMKDKNDKEATLLFSFETEPSLPSIDYTKFEKTPVPTKEVGDKEVDEAIRQMQFFFAEWTPIAERGIQEGDFVLIDLFTTEPTGEEQKVFDKVRFEVRPERMAPWMQNLLLGAHMGDTLHGESAVDENASEEDKAAFQKKPVRVVVHMVEGASLPPLDEEFTKKVGATSLSDLRERVLSDLQSQAKSKERSLYHEQVSRFLVDTYPIDLPPSVVQNEKEHRLSQALRHEGNQKEWEGMSAEEKQKVEAKMEIEAQDAVRIFYLSRHIVQQEKIPTSHQEIEREMVQILREFGMHPQQMEKPSKELYALALSRLILRKAQEHVLHASSPAS